jgi:hypothetical protein
MAKVRLLGGKPLMVGGKVALSDDCCCAPGGACCIGFDPGSGYGGTCEVLSEEECATAGGMWGGEGTSCDPDPCPTRACCFGTGISQTCDTRTFDDCFGSGGVPFPDFIFCEPTPCCPTVNLHFACSGTIDLSCDGSGCVIDFDFSRNLNLALDPGCTVSTSGFIIDTSGFGQCLEPVGGDCSGTTSACTARWTYSFSGGPAGWSITLTFLIENCGSCALSLTTSGSGVGNGNANSNFDFCGGSGGGGTTVTLACDVGFS